MEVCLDDRWGTVCDNGWDSNEASVVCGQLGYARTGESVERVRNQIRDDILFPLPHVYSCMDAPRFSIV